MKASKLFQTLVVSAATSVAFAAFSADKTVGGPKGGRLLENQAPRAEFLVEKDRTVTITFYDASLKAVPPGEQVVSAIAEPTSGKIKLEFEKKGDVLVSKTALPEGDGYNVVVQIKANPGARPQNFRIKFETHLCGECKRPEYACTCGH